MKNLLLSPSTFVILVGLSTVSLAETDKKDFRACVQQANAGSQLSDQCKNEANSYGEARRAEAERVQIQNRACVQQANAHVPLSEHCTDN